MKKKFLVVVDNSKELKNAIHFAAQRAKNTNGKEQVWMTRCPSLKVTLRL